jgi:hypothetical protein
MQSVTRLRKCFAGLYSLDEGECEEAVKDALSNPDDYVMKPQREGGGTSSLSLAPAMSVQSFAHTHSDSFSLTPQGNNLYGEQLKHALSTMSAQVGMPAENGELSEGRALVTDVDQNRCRNGRPIF